MAECLLEFVLIRSEGVYDPVNKLMLFRSWEAPEHWGLRDVHLGEVLQESLQLVLYIEMF